MAETTQTESTPPDVAAFGIGKYQDQGPRPNLEDKYGVETIETQDNFKLTVAVMADGVGGTNAGEVAADLAVQTVMTFLKEAELGEANNIPELLAQALGSANEKVYRESRTDKEKEGMGTTAAVVAIHENEAYIANVGDSRVYLVRDGLAQQATYDHSWANEMIRMHQADKTTGLNEKEAYKHPKADELFRSIGHDRRVRPDLGVYLNGDIDEAAARQQQPIKLKPEDRVVLCSDGLIKERRGAQGQYVEDEEIEYLVTHRLPQKAAEMLVEKALSRRANDNVSVIVLEAPNSSTKFFMPFSNQQLIMGGAIAAILFLFGLFSILGGRRGDPPPSTTGGRPTLPALAAVSDTPLPNATQPVIEQDNIATPRPTLVALANSVNIRGCQNIADVSLLFSPDADGTCIPPSASGEPLHLTLNRGTLVANTTTQELIVSNPFGAKVRVLTGTAGVNVDTNNVLRVFCFEGTCDLIGDISGQQTLIAGQAGLVSGAGSPADWTATDEDYSLFSQLAPNIVPTLTPTPTPTETPTPTVTPTPTPTRRIFNTATPTTQPDQDGDGVPDSVDNCPDDFGVSVNKGCPQQDNPDPVPQPTSPPQPQPTSPPQPTPTTGL